MALLDLPRYHIDIEEASYTLVRSSLGGSMPTRGVVIFPPSFSPYTASMPEWFCRALSKDDASFSPNSYLPNWWYFGAPPNKQTLQRRRFSSKLRSSPPLPLPRLWYTDLGILAAGL